MIKTENASERLTLNDLKKVFYYPWELCGLNNYCKKGRYEKDGCTKGCKIIKIYKKLADYEDMEESGKMYKGYFAIGDIVYAIVEKSIKKCKVVGVTFNSKSQVYISFATDHRGRVPVTVTFYDTDINNVVFANSDDAARALNQW